MLAERAEALDHAELVLSVDVREDHRSEMARNREALDDDLSRPIGKQAAAEAALLRELGGAA